MNQVNIFMTGWLGTSWRTTVLGFIVAAGNMLINGVSVKTALVSAAIQTAGILMNDAQAHSTSAEIQQATQEAATAAKKIQSE